MKKRARKIKTLRKEEIAEDWCFVCKDGGNLLICDYKQCLKAYHPYCIGKDESLLTSEQCWHCNWHSCFMCQRKTSRLHCYCCPNAVCQFCINAAEFVHVRGNYGFCNTCLKLAVLIEENMDVDSDGERVDFRDRETYEGLFMEYYKVIQEKEGFKIDDIRAAKDRVKTGDPDSDEFVDDENDEDDEMISEDEAEDFKTQRRKKGRKGQVAVKQKIVKSKQMQFTGWGSTPLLQFLESIGKDTSEELSQRSVEAIINAYIGEHKLIHPKKKRKFLCDKNLQTIFGRKVVNKNRIYELLEAHYFDNLEKSDEEEEDEEVAYYSEDKDEDASVACKTRRKSKGEKEFLKSVAVVSAPHSCFASITAENIKLVYLRRSLVHELSRKPESFENKVIGSFIRVKSDPNDFRQTNSHQLMQVTGVKKASTGEDNAEMILHGLNMPGEIHMNLLSDADFSLEECEDLRQKVKDGLVQKLTVVELQQKARLLHVDITKHWVARELKLLDQRIDQANEKGRRRELFEYMEKRKQLQTPSEQLQMLENYPTVMPEELGPMTEEIMHDKNENDTPPESVLPIDPSCKWEGNRTSRCKECHDHASNQDKKPNLPEISLPLSPNQSASTDKKNQTVAKTLEESREQLLASKGQCKVALQRNCEMHCSSIAGTMKNQGKKFHDHVSDQDEKQNLPDISRTESPNHSALTDKKNKTLAKTLEGCPELLLNSEYQCKVTFQSNADMHSSSIAVTMQNKGTDADQTASHMLEPHVDNVIVLSSDDESNSTNAVRKQNREDTESRVWHISGPDGERLDRKYSLSLLKCWSETSAYALKFKAWKENESEEHAIWLGDAIKRAFTRQ